jgi:glycine betaine/proline transport system substrate-binding protein
MKKLTVILLLALLAITVLPGCGQDAEPAEKPTIKLSELNWGSAQFQSQTAKIIIEKGYGYPVELIPGNTIVLLQGLRNNDLDIYLEGWLQNSQEAVDEAIAAGDIEMLGILNDDNWQSAFVIPGYVINGDAERGIEPMLPDLKTVQDLLSPEAMELFQNPENKSKGLIMNGPPGWECEIVLAEQVDAYGLADSYDTANAGSSDMLFASLQGAYDKGEPWLGYLWGPTWIAGALDLTLLEEPAYDKAVWDDNRACGWPSVDLFVAVHKDFPEKAPDVTAMLEKWQMDSATLEAVLAYMNENDYTAEQAAVWFLQNYEDLWTPFVPADVAAKVKTAAAGM